MLFLQQLFAVMDLHPSGETCVWSEQTVFLLKQYKVIGEKANAFCKSM